MDIGKIAVVGKGHNRGLTSNKKMMIMEAIGPLESFTIEDVYQKVSSLGVTEEDIRETLAYWVGIGYISVAPEQLDV